jgi:hypothetical protein
MSRYANTFKSHLKSLTIGGIASAMIACSILFASIPDASGAVTACYNKATGALRVVDVGKGQGCLLTESLLSWNHQGVPGPPGLPGTNGTPGTNGVDGVSVIAQALSPGDPNCPSGGSKFTSVNGDTFACNGANGTSASGSTFSGELQPNQDMEHILDNGLIVGANCSATGGLFGGPSMRIGVGDFTLTTFDFRMRVIAGTITDATGIRPFVGGDFEGVSGPAQLPLTEAITAQVQGTTRIDVIAAPDDDLNNLRRISVMARLGRDDVCRFVGTSNPVGGQ